MSWELVPPDADVYFTAGYHRLHELEGIGTAWCAGLRREGKTLVVAGMCEAIPGGGFDLQSCNGYGGPLGVGVDAPLLADAWSAIRSRAVGDGIIAAMFRLHPVIDNARWLPGTAVVRDDRRTVFVPLDGGAEAAWKGADTRHRNMVSKARRAGTPVSWDDPRSWREFERLYGEAMDRLDAAAHLRFGRAYFAALSQLPGARLAALWDRDTLLAGSVFLFGPRLAHYHLSARRADAPNYAANFLLQAAIEAAAERGLEGLHVGGGTTPREDDPLLKFKRSLGGELLPFRVARVVFDEGRFDELVADWRRRSGRDPRWLLGYREPA